MTLMEAINSGKKFRRGNDGWFKDASSYEDGFMLDDVLATDYTLEPDIIATVPVNILMAAWNAAAVGRSTIASAENSRFFNEVKAQLISRGVNVV